MMAQNTLIARAGRGLLDILTLLMRGVGALCAVCGSLFLTLLSYHDVDDSSSEHGEALPDGLTPLEREQIARTEGWKSW